MSWETERLATKLEDLIKRGKESAANERQAIDALSPVLDEPLIDLTVEGELSGFLVELEALAEYIVPALRGESLEHMPIGRL